MFHSRIHVLHCSYGVLNGFVSVGAIAMTGFFLLSGYTLNLSTQRMDMTDAKTIRKFYIKRLISIIPLYYSYAVLNVIINIVRNGGHAVLEEAALFPIETLGLQSVFATLFPYSHNGGSWFISCILICYFVFPLIQSLTRDISDKTRMLTIVILGGILLWSPFVQHYFHTTSIYANPFFRMFEFSIGILVCQMNLQQSTTTKIIRILRNPSVCITTFILLVGGVSIAHKIGIPGDFILYNWVALPCFISLLVSLGYIKFEKLQGSKTIQYLSALSFSIFLSQLIVVWHSVKITMAYIGCESNVANIVVSATICFCLANLFHFCIEEPSAKYLKAKLLK